MKVNPPQRKRLVFASWCVAFAALCVSSSTAQPTSSGAGADDATARAQARRLPGGGLHADVSIACSGCAATVRQVNELLERPSRDALERTVREYDASSVRSTRIACIPAHVVHARCSLTCIFFFFGFHRQVIPHTLNVSVYDALRDGGDARDALREKPEVSERHPEGGVRRRLLGALRAQTNVAG